MATASLRHHSKSRLEATSIADFPVVPLEQETWWPLSCSFSIQSSMSRIRDGSCGGTRYVETVSSHLPSRSQRSCASQDSG